MATLLTAQGISAEVKPKGKAFTLEELYGLIGCSTVEMVRLADGRLMWLDEDGKSKQLPPNQKATELLMAAGGMPGDFVGGTVLLTTEKEGG